MNAKFTLAAIAGGLISTLAAHAQLLAGWDTSTLTGGAGNWGPSPLTATVTDPNLTVSTQLTRGSGVGTLVANSAAARAWGGHDWQNTTAANAIANGDTITFDIQANTGYTLSLSAFNLAYRRSSTGANSGLLQAQVGTGGYFDITTFNYSVSTSTGATLPAVDLTGFSALQNVAAGVPVSFRLANFGGTTVNGTWYVWDIAPTSTAPDLSVSGTLAAAAVPEPSEYAAMAGAGLVGFAIWRRRMARKA
jgi:hypothetical protein